MQVEEQVPRRGSNPSIKSSVPAKAGPCEQTRVPKGIKLCKTKSQDSYQYMIWGCWLKSEPVPLWLNVRGRD